MKRGIVIATVFVISAFVLSGCSNELSIKVNSTLEYGKEYKVEDIFKASKKDTKIETNLTIDTKLVGEYEVKIKAVNKEEKKEEVKKVIVKDTKKPKITFLQDIKKTFDVPLHSEFDIAGNLDECKDEVDANINKIEVLDVTQFDELQKTIKNSNSDLLKRKFKSEEEITKAKEETKENTMCIYIASTIDVTVPGEYAIKTMAIDSNYNITSKQYKVKVLNDSESVKEGMLAAGVKDGPIGKLADEYAKSLQQTQEKANTEESVTSVGAQVDVNKYKNTGSITSTNPTVKAAKSHVGQKLWCDELVSAALVESGRISGGNSGLFEGVVGVYYFPSLGTFISQGQAVPGDLVYYDNGGLGVPHIAVYAGNGQAIHGGFGGGYVVVHSVNIGSGPKFLRFPNHMSWDEINTIVFGFTTGGNSNSNTNGPDTTPSQPLPNTPEVPDTPLPDYGGETEVINTYTATYDGEKINVEGKNVEHSVMEDIVWQYFAGTIDKATMESKLKALGCTVTYG